MKRLTLAVLAAVTLCATAAAQLTYTVPANGDLPRAPFALDRVEVQASAASRVYVDLLWPGLTLGMPYGIVWDRAASCGASIAGVPLHGFTIPYAGSVGGTHAWSEGVALTFFVPDHVTTLDDPALLRRLQGKGEVPLDWSYSDGGQFYSTTPNVPTGFGVSPRFLDVEFEVTYYPAEPEAAFELLARAAPLT